jgi:hypothetical protein
MSIDREHDDYKSNVDQLFLKKSAALYVKFRVEFMDRCTEMSRLQDNASRSTDAMNHDIVPDGYEDALHLRHKVLVFKQWFVAHQTSHRDPRLTGLEFLNSSNDVLSTKN